MDLINVYTQELTWDVLILNDFKRVTKLDQWLFATCSLCASLRVKTHPWQADCG